MTINITNLFVFSRLSADDGLGASRLIWEDNGYGAATSIEYRSAKTDSRTPHQVPFPEIVVANVTTVAEKGLANQPDQEPTEYAYGDIEMLYDSITGRWQSTGYGRRVTLQRLPRTFFPVGIAQISDQITLDDELMPRFLVGLPQDQHMLRGVLVETNAWDFLNVDVTQDSRWHGSTHTDYDSAVLAGDLQIIDSDLGINDLGWEVLTPHSDSKSYRKFITLHATVYPKSTRSWFGSNNYGGFVQTQTDTEQVDDHGRPTAIHYYNDTLRSDDDVCQTMTYASGSGG